MINLKDRRVILASQSPRRQELIKGLDIDFIIQTADIDESFPSQLKKEEIPMYLAGEKAKVMLKNLTEKDILITADTIVWLNGKAVNKPKNRSEAYQMISELSGNEHTVYTGVQLSTTKEKKLFFAETKVTFSRLEQAEIKYYIDKYQPFDKAGAYGIQEWIGYIGIEKIEGSYFNVMGFPLHLVYQNLKELLQNN